MQVDEYSSFLDLDTGHVEHVPDAFLGKAEHGEMPHLVEWEESIWEMAKQIVASRDRFLDLPSKFDIHEWEIMQDFSLSVKSGAIREDLLSAIHGAGAFRHFKDTIQRHGIEPAWFAFRAEALKQIAIDWCEENRIAWK